MQTISESLEALATAIDKGTDLVKAAEAIKSTRELTKGKDGPILKELDAELSVWQSKFSVIMNEPVGKKGMAKHARFWAAKLKIADSI